jgi:hypothetical protein
VRTIWNTQIHSVGKMQNFWMLKQMVRTVTTVFKWLTLSTCHRVYDSEIGNLATGAWRRK